jgi:hypothetical protein
MVPGIPEKDVVPEAARDLVVAAALAPPEVQRVAHQDVGIVRPDQPVPTERARPRYHVPLPDVDIAVPKSRSPASRRPTTAYLSSSSGVEVRSDRRANDAHHGTLSPRPPASFGRAGPSGELEGRRAGARPGAARGVVVLGRSPASRADPSPRDTRPRPAPGCIRPGSRRLSRQPRRPRADPRQPRQPAPVARLPGDQRVTRLPRGCHGRPDVRRAPRGAV